MVKKYGDTMRRILALTMLLYSLSAPSVAALTASVDRTDIALGDIITLNLSSETGAELSNLDLSSVEASFELLGQSSSSNLQIINGAVTRSNTLRIDLTPKRQGIAVIPALEIDGERTEPINIEVGPPVVATSGDSTLNFRAESDRQSVYVQGQVRLTITIERAINLDDLNVSELEIPNAHVELVEQQTFQRTIAGKPWIIHELHYVIFPEQSGSLTIPSLRLSGREMLGGGGLFARSRAGQLITRNTAPITVTVKPIPYSFPDSPWIVAEALTLDDNLGDSISVRAGEALTRTLTLRGTGVQGVQLPPIPTRLPQALKYYPDQPVIKDLDSAQGLSGERIESSAIIASQEGSVTLEAIEIPFWNSVTDQLDFARLPERRLTISPRVLQETDQPRPRDEFVMAPPPSLDDSQFDQTPESTPLSQPIVTAGWWPMITGTITLLWLATLLWGWRRGQAHKKSAAPTSAANESQSELLRQAIDAARHSDAGQTLQHLRALVHALPESQSTHLDGIESLGQRIGSASLECELQELLRQRYSAAPQTWQGTVLAKLLRQHRREIEQLLAPRSDASLRLYPPN